MEITYFYHSDLLLLKSVPLTISSKHLKILQKVCHVFVTSPTQTIDPGVVPTVNHSFLKSCLYNAQVNGSFATFS